MKVYLVWAEEMHEPSILCAVYATKGQADAVATAASAYDRTASIWSGGSPSPAIIESWGKAHPLGPRVARAFNVPDSYAVEEWEVLP